MALWKRGPLFATYMLKASRSAKSPWAFTFPAIPSAAHCVARNLPAISEIGSEF